SAAAPARAWRSGRIRSSAPRPPPRGLGRGTPRRSPKPRTDNRSEPPGRPAAIDRPRGNRPAGPPHPDADLGRRRPQPGPDCASEPREPRDPRRAHRPHFGTGATPASLVRPGPAPRLPRSLDQNGDWLRVFEGPVLVLVSTS